MNIVMFILYYITLQVHFFFSLKQKKKKKTVNKETRIVHRSVRVEFVPNSQLTQSNLVEEF